jgi:hypothetical protein
VRVSAAAVGAAALAVTLVALGDAKHPALVVVALAAGGAFLATQSKGRNATPSDWFTARLLLAGNLVVFGVTSADGLGDFLAAVLVLLGVLLAAAATHQRVRRLRGHNGKR